MKARRLVIASMMLAALLFALAMGSSADSTPMVSLRTSSTSVEVGDTVNVDIRVENVSDLYGADIKLEFDEALLQVLDDDADEGGVQILPGSLFPSVEPTFVVLNQADNVAGKVRFAMTLLSPAAPVSGSGTLATIRFTARAEGTAQLSWLASTLVNSSGDAIAHTQQGLAIEIGLETPTPTPTPTNTPTPAPTATPPPSPTPCPDNCTDLIDNGDFEATRSWDMPVTPHKANYSTADKHGGSRSVRLGIEPGDADVYSHSSSYQEIHVPANANSVTLSFWARRFTDETPKAAAIDPAVDLYDPAEVIEGTFDYGAQSKGSQYDWQEVLILQADCYNWLATLMRDRSDDGLWTRYTYDLTAFAGQDIVVYFNVINNGSGGRRTWMYVDDVVVDACYGPAPCTELVRNRSFEWTGEWSHPATPRTANYTTDYAHTGSRSMRHGVVPSTWDVYSHSSAYQKITIPAGASNPTLSFWYKAHSQDAIKGVWASKSEVDYNPADVIAGQNPALKGSVEDWQEMLILDASYRLLSGGVVMRQVSNDGVWKQKTYDLSPYRGMTIVLYFNVINDGDGQRTWMYVDDVSVNLCGQQVRIAPASQTADVGDVFTVNVRAENVSDLYALDATIRFDPSVLEVLEVKAGDWWAGMGPYVVLNTVDNASGMLRFAATLKAPQTPLNGSGNLVSIRLQAQTPGSTPLWFSALKLVNDDAIVFPVGHTDGQAIVEGSAPPPDLPGDVDGNGCVNIFDLVAVGSQFGSTSPSPSEADVNDDGKVDIVDIVLVATNFGTGTCVP